MRWSVSKQGSSERHASTRAQPLQSCNGILKPMPSPNEYADVGPLVTTNVGISNFFTSAPFKEFKLQDAVIVSGLASS